MKVKISKAIFFVCLALGASVAYALTPAPGTGGTVLCDQNYCYKGCTKCERGPTGSCSNDPQCRGI